MNPIDLSLRDIDLQLGQGFSFRDVFTLGALITPHKRPDNRALMK